MKAARATASIEWPRGTARPPRGRQRRGRPARPWPRAGTRRTRPGRPRQTRTRSRAEAAARGRLERQQPGGRRGRPSRDRDHAPGDRATRGAKPAGGGWDVMKSRTSVPGRLDDGLAAEEVVDAGGVEQHERHADHGDDQHHRQRVGLRRRVEDRQVVLRVDRRDQQIRVEADGGREQQARRSWPTRRGRRQK